MTPRAAAHEVNEILRWAVRHGWSVSRRGNDHFRLRKGGAEVPCSSTPGTAIRRMVIGKLRAAERRMGRKDVRDA